MPIRLFTTCPPWQATDTCPYLEQVGQVARWSDQAGCEGILVYTDNSLPDPWLVAQAILEQTKTLSPLVAVQPVYMHPYSVAKMVTSLSSLYGRRISLNLVAGGFKNDLASLGDATPHDRRYDRLREYLHIVLELLGGRTLTFRGEFYQLENCRLSPPLPSHLFPVVTMAGSSPAGLAVAEALGAIAVQYPEPPDECPAANPTPTVATGIRIGIIARPSESEAWQLAYQRFPPDRAGQVTHQLAMKVSDSSWHRKLSELGRSAPTNNYWLVPFENYKTFCPYLVGSYDQVAARIAAYLAAGHQTFILDVPASAEDLTHISRVFSGAQKAAA